MRRIAIIPARGGSKRLPRKNILEFMGKPIIAWTIESALETGLFDHVYVSTEDQEIADIAVHYGAKLDERPEELAADTAGVRDVCIEFLSRHPCELLCVLYATAPLRTADDIKSVVNLLEPGTCDFALAAAHYGQPPHQALKRTGEHTVKPMWPDIVSARASDIGELVVDNGSTYAFHVPAFLENKSFYAPDMRVYMMPRERSQDIDEALDFELAGFFAARNQAQAG